MLSILLYGATGCLGRLVADHLSQSIHEITVAGKNVPELMAAFGLGEPTDGMTDSPTRVKFCRLDLANSTVAVDIISKYDVLINCDTPYSKSCIPLIKCCLKANTHYVDLCSELEISETVIGYLNGLNDVNICVLHGFSFSNVIASILINESIINGVQHDCCHVDMITTLNKIAYFDHSAMVDLLSGRRERLDGKIANSGLPLQTSGLVRFPGELPLKTTEFPHSLTLLLRKYFGFDSVSCNLSLSPKQERYFTYFKRTKSIFRGLLTPQTARLWRKSIGKAFSKAAVETENTSSKNRDAIKISLFNKGKRNFEAFVIIDCPIRISFDFLNNALRQIIEGDYSASAGLASPAAFAENNIYFEIQGSNQK